MKFQEVILNARCPLKESLAIPWKEFVKEFKEYVKKKGSTLEPIITARKKFDVPEKEKGTIWNINFDYLNLNKVYKMGEEEAFNRVINKIGKRVFGKEMFKCKWEDTTQKSFDNLVSKCTIKIPKSESIKELEWIGERNVVGSIQDVFRDKDEGEITTFLKEHCLPTE